MPEGRNETFFCPACGEHELTLPEGTDPQKTSYLSLAALDDCTPAKEGEFVYGNGYTTGFGGVVREKDPEGGIRERWVPPKTPVAYLFYRGQEYLAQNHPMPDFYPAPLFRNRVVIDGIEHVFVAIAFLPHNEVPTPELRARGEALAKSMR